VGWNKEERGGEGEGEEGWSGGRPGGKWQAGREGGRQGERGVPALCRSRDKPVASELLTDP
jgi:hypothetical protein